MVVRVGWGERKLQSKSKPVARITSTQVEKIKIMNLFLLALKCAYFCNLFLWFVDVIIARSCATNAVGLNQFKI